MAVKEKYQSVLDLGEKLNIQNGDVWVEDGILKVKGTAATQYEKNLIWDEIKAVAGEESPTDIKVILIQDNLELAKFIRQNIYGDKIVIGMGAGSISNWIRELPALL